MSENEVAYGKGPSPRTQRARLSARILIESELTDEDVRVLAHVADMLTWTEEMRDATVRLNEAAHSFFMEAMARHELDAQRVEAEEQQS